MQNKLEWAITGQTAPDKSAGSGFALAQRVSGRIVRHELIHNRADAEQPNMGLQTWKNAPDGKILKCDVSVAKNYLHEKKIKELERIVSMYLDYAENQAARQIPMKMSDWIQKLDAFLQFNEYEILQDAGRISRTVAEKLVHQEYEKFRVSQDRTFESDFDKVVKRLRPNSGK